MRVQHWIAPALIVFLLLAGGKDASAQFVPGGPVPPERHWLAGGHLRSPEPILQTGSGAFPGPLPMSNGLAAPQGLPGALPSGFSSVSVNPAGAAQMQPGMLPWPTISPFDYNFSQHVIKEGLWHSEMSNQQPEYFFDLEFWDARLRHTERNSLTGGNFPNVNLGSVFRHDFKSEAIRGRWGFTNADGTGMEITGWWTPDVTEVNAQFPGLRYNTEAFGASIDHLHTPLWQRSFLTIRPLWGLRYFFIRENLMNSGAPVGGTQQTGTTPFETQTRSHLAGPEIGLQFDMGRFNFLKIWGQSKFGVLANREKTNFEVSTLNLADTEDTTHHVSPSFEQSIFFQMKIFEYVPGLRRVQILEDAAFRVGYTYIIVGEVVRPGRSVAYGLQPELKPDRSQWHVRGWSFGVDWTY